ncbi:diguanylate cyclase/phosphodiesterase with PAS/PAC sensor(s) [Psychromonas ingrahamii 37]|uniref:Diguanylate cyclase/phosphodiesterase with PAS/PAC sensor(S) n=1 Tax=Psychromonas ingrahamii (strain DSM 17664 / CCUG 51855 / 37) TaxID=357804 RepID=A1SU69_PSYIN|nr:EAL domain-containing protein [Psychromonas ingrahamii]ABM03034.1 diguanylate cyclase/phosphodiesterase with PAS/PAC sensor(s) [Psychromonas ingrahamii 37]
MKLINCQFRTKNDLELFIDQNINDANISILIQVFSGDLNIAHVQQVLDTLKFKLPHATIIGCSTAGEIASGAMKKNTIQISFSLFEKTNLQLFYYPQTNFTTGEKASCDVISQNTKAVIAFNEAFKGDAELFFEGFSSKKQNAPISGGNAGDNLLYGKTFVIYDDKIYFEGIVLCALNSDSLHAHTNHSFSSASIGTEMIVTKAVDNVIYEIDYTPVDKIYRYYLGDNILQHFPMSVVEFPLVKIEGEMTVARSAARINEDGGFLYIGHFENGDKVKFAITNSVETFSKSDDLYTKIMSNPVEATYVYSCAGRKRFPTKCLNYELGLIEKVAPSSGFFSYGEFFYSKTKNHLLTLTTTTLSLSETDIIQSPDEIPKRINGHSILNPLIHLVNVSDTNLNQYKQLLDKSSIVSKADIQGVIIYVNDNFCKISGYSREELIGKNHSIVRHPDNSNSIFKNMWTTITAKKVWKGTLKNRAKDGSTYYVKTLIMPILDDQGHIVSYIAARTDVTELIKKDEIIKQQNEDKLTGLKNRSALIDKLKDIKREDATLILMNIDRFSDINDYYGYEKGDKTLEHFASVLKGKYVEFSRISSDVSSVSCDIFRISGDEFAILCEHSLDKKIKEMIAGLIMSLENEVYEILDDKITLLLSCGVANGAKNEIYNLAHIALKENKKDNNTVTFFNDNMNLYNKIAENIKVIASIKEGILNDKFVPFYQGIVNNKTKKITKYECLIRLKEENGKVLTPYFFLEHAKKAKLYYKLTMIMIRKSFEKFAGNNSDFSINFTLQDIQSETVVSMLMDYLERYQCGNRLIIEIVESEGIENFNELSDFIKQIKKYGCKVAIDDFGSGYSNFHYLSKLDVDYIKIDGSLIKNIDNDPSQLATVESILLFAKKMNIKTIAEFVETKNIYDILNDLGVDFSQGYYFSKPQEEIEK